MEPPSADCVRKRKTCKTNAERKCPSLTLRVSKTHARACFHQPEASARALRTSSSHHQHQAIINSAICSWETDDADILRAGDCARLPRERVLGGRPGKVAARESAARPGR